jgi:hypothetical protein
MPYAPEGATGINKKTKRNGGVAQANAESKDLLEVIMMIARNQTQDLTDIVLEWVKRFVYTV